VVEDALQQTFLQAHLARDRIDPSRPLVAWLVTIAKNVSATQAARERAELARRARGAVMGLSPANPETDLAGRQLASSLSQAYADLSPVLREALEAFEDHDGDYERVASNIGATQGTARVRVHRARAQLLQASGIGARR
jgi:RNA polymerase sigma factor CnrH